MTVSRRTFFKICGAAPLAAAVPYSVVSAAEIVEPNIIVTNLIPGSRVGIWTADMAEQIFLGEAKTETITAHFETEEPREVIIRIRKPGWKPMQVYGGMNENGLHYHIHQMKDEAYEI